jgi:hypothetical protein
MPSHDDQKDQSLSDEDPTTTKDDHLSSSAAALAPEDADANTRTRDVLLEPGKRYRPFEALWPTAKGSEVSKNTPR